MNIAERLLILEQENKDFKELKNIRTLEDVEDILWKALSITTSNENWLSSGCDGGNEEWTYENLINLLKQFYKKTQTLKNHIHSWNYGDDEQSACICDICGMNGDI